VRRQPITSRRARGAFTLVELLLMILIVAILIGLLTVGMRHALAVARGAAGKQDVASLKIAVESFRNDFGFPPPLVKDGYPGTPGSPSEPLRAIGTRTSPWTYQSGLSGQPERDDDREYLQQDSGEDDYRFSNYSLAYYLIGALGKDIDGQEGPGSHKPLRDGSFDRMTNDTYPARYETKGGQLASKPWPSDGPQTYGRWEIQDRNGVAYRYYRWEPFPSDDSGYDDAHPLAELRVPRLFGDAAFDEDPDYSPAQERQEFRDAGYAIVAAGADGVFGDISDSYGYEEGVNEVYPTLESLSSVLEGLGRRFSGSDEEIKTQAENAARADNIVEVGR
jgi:type II secretory pathway pseudopilin PulG